MGERTYEVQEAHTGREGTDAEGVGKILNAANWSRFKAMVAAATGVKHTHRFRVIDKVITQGATTVSPLLTASDAPDYDAGGDLTTTAQCETNSRITGIDLKMIITPGATGAHIEWMLWKDPDLALTVARVPSELFQNDITANVALLRKYTLAYGMVRSSSTKEGAALHVRISRAALKRSAVMKDDDVLRLTFVHTTAATNGSLSAYGRIWTRK